MQCQACTTEQPDGAKFCSQCGVKLPPPVVSLLNGRCPDCGCENLPSSRFCSECGAALPITSAHPAPLADHAPLRFVIANGVTIHISPGATTSNTWIIGREDPVNDIHPDIDLTPHDPNSSVSRRHAQITLSGDRCVLTSLTTTNWTALNGSRLAPQQAVLLSPGDRIEFAHCAVTFER